MKTQKKIGKTIAKMLRNWKGKMISITATDTE
jgi:hypothetical protein